MNNKYIFLIIILTALLVSSCEKEVFTGPPEDPLPVNGQIFVDSKPQGSLIYVNGRNYGVFTPDTLKWLNQLNYTITLKSNIFPDESFNIIPVEGILKTCYVDYMANPFNAANINCTSEPENAQIILNDSALNLTTPATITGLFPGTFKIKYTYPEHRADSLELFVKGSETGEAYLALEDTSVFVSHKKSNSNIASDILSSVVVDANGIKWIGFRDKGLMKFNGIEWTHYNDANTILPSNAVNCLAIDKDNNLWVGTTLGLVKYNGIEWTNYSYLLPHFYVSAIAFDSKGNGWFGTQGGLVKFNGSNYVIYKTISSGLSDNFITALIPEDTNIWIGTNSGGINYFDGTNWTLYNKLNTQMQGDGVLSGLIDHSGVKWFDILPMPLLNEDGGLVKYDGVNWNTASIGSSMELRKVYSIIEDEELNLWFGTKSGLAKMTPDGNVSLFNADNSNVPSVQVNKLAIDKNNNLWLATYGGGLIKFKKNSL